MQPLLPVHVNPHRFGGGRPRVPDRRCADAIFYVLGTGCQWQALDQTDLCAHSTAHDRFQAWVQAGVFLNLWQAEVEQFDELYGIDWDWLSLDGAMTKALLGGGKTGPNPTDPGVFRSFRNFLRSLSWGKVQIVNSSRLSQTTNFSTGRESRNS